MAYLNDTLYAIGDSGTDDKMAELDANCAVQRWIPVPVDPYDIEDMSAYGDSIWLSDTGDNLRRRDTVALTRLDPSSGAGELYRLTYPDGPHDAESLIVEPGGRPVIITKEFSGNSGVYVPDADTAADKLPTPGPSGLRRVGALNLNTAAGVPVPGELVTGAALSADGRAAAVRTYSQVYLYPVRDGDVAAALTNETPVVVTAPKQPQGESVEFTVPGDLIVASETGGELRPLPPILVLSDAANLVAPSDTAENPIEAPGSSATWWWVGGAAVLIGLTVLGVGAIARRRRR
ncbi:hypothetical protein [Aldersonia kunmingensis]|uniref:hypothetical protein n=1 Tax=Aldersonia kunmingensis TaxID=408066 RepID=UPI001FDEAA18|nr:hypothetical protein [Aldersonia kunmingensis]